MAFAAKVNPFRGKLSQVTTAAGDSRQPGPAHGDADNAVRGGAATPSSGGSAEVRLGKGEVVATELRALGDEEP